MAIVLATYGLLMLQRDNRELRRSMLTIPVLAILITAVSYFASPLFQERLELAAESHRIPLVLGGSGSWSRAGTSRLAANFVELAGLVSELT